MSSAFLPSTDHAVFEKFGLLPLELRRKIWKCAIPFGRIFEFVPDGVFRFIPEVDEDKTSVAYNSHCFAGKRPIIYNVSAEARQVTLEHCQVASNRVAYRQPTVFDHDVDTLFYPLKYTKRRPSFSGLSRLHTLKKVNLKHFAVCDSWLDTAKRADAFQRLFYFKNLETVTIVFGASEYEYVEASMCKWIDIGLFEEEAAVANRSEEDWDDGQTKGGWHMGWCVYNREGETISELMAIYKELFEKALTAESDSSDNVRSRVPELRFVGSRGWKTRTAARPIRFPHNEMNEYDSARW